VGLHRRNRVQGQENKAKNERCKTKSFADRRHLSERGKAHRSRSFFITVNPVIWLTMLMPMLMRHGKHVNVVFFERIQKLVREFMEQAFPYIAALN
jgi:hypothetical protein